MTLQCPNCKNCFEWNSDDDCFVHCVRCDSNLMVDVKVTVFTIDQEFNITEFIEDAGN